MVITDETIQVNRTPSITPPRRPLRRLLGIGTAILVVAAAAFATFASALVDTPEVRAFMQFVASPEWGGFISPNRDVQIRCFRSDADQDRGFTEGDNGEVIAGAFWQGMLDWVDGVRTIDQVFADIDAEWAALKAAGEVPAHDP